MVADLDGEAADQLRRELQDSIHRAGLSGRPLLTHLNADTTWLLSIAYPTEVTPPAGRTRFNILIDPWLQGPQSDVASWFSTQWHAVKSSVETIAELNTILAETERSEGAENSNQHAHSSCFIDLVAISHEFTDHCHEATLKEIPPSVPVFATTKAAAHIKSWGHFSTVVDMAPFSNGVDWRATSLSPLPSWLGISRLVTEADALYYHSAIVICSQKPASGNVAEAVVYTPHGVEAATFSTLATAQPRVETLAFLHGLHDVSITLTKQLNLGAHNALKAQRLLKAKYWVGTHDEVKRGGGLLAPFLRRKAYTLLDALSKEGKPRGEEVFSNGNPAPEPSYMDLGSGQSLLLE